MELWELNACVQEFNLMQSEKMKENIAVSWQTANFTGAAFGGKLKKLSVYLKNNSINKAPKINREDFEKKLNLAVKEVQNGP